MHTDASSRSVKDGAVSNGGTITHEYKLIKAFAYASSLPLDYLNRTISLMAVMFYSVALPEVSTLDFAHQHPEVEHVEQDQEMKTQ